MSAQGSTARPRRERSLREVLLSVVLGLEAVVIVFATLALNGLTDLPDSLVFGGGLTLVVVFGVVAALQRWIWGVVLGGALQVALVALGFVIPAMFVVGGGFAVLWVWCLVRARRAEIERRAAAEGGG